MSSNILVEDDFFSINGSNISSSFNGSSEESACASLNVYLKWLNTYYVPVIILVGFVGNILSCLVLMTTHLKLRSSSYYLAALAVADLGYLFAVFVVYASYNQLFELFNKYGFCEAITYGGSVCACLSVWLTVAFTAERWVAVRFPLRRPSWCTATRARRAVAALVLLASIFQLPLLWVVGVRPTPGARPASPCGIVDRHERLARTFNFVDTFATLVLPVVLIVAMNAQIARAVFRSRKALLAAPHAKAKQDRLRLRPAGSQSSNNSTKMTQESDSSASMRRHGGYNNFCQEYQYIDLRGSSKSSRRPSTRSNTTAQVQQNINKMLLLVSSVFIALNFPSYMARMYTYFGFRLREENPPMALICVQEFSMLLYYTNFAVNFLLYAMCGRTFRLCLKNMFRDSARRAYDCACAKGLPPPLPPGPC